MGVRTYGSACESQTTNSEKKVLKMKSVLSEVFTNPFSDELHPNKLYNVASGCPTSNDVTECLLLVRQNGKMLHAEFNLRLTKCQ